MEALFANLLHVFLMGWLIRREWRKNSILVYYCLFALFLILVPLSLDALFLTFGDEEQYVALLEEANPSSINDFSFMSMEIVRDYSLYAFVFDISFVFAFLLLTKGIRYDALDYTSIRYWPFPVYLTSGIMAVGLFVWIFGIGFDESYAENMNVTFSTRMGLLLFNLALMTSYVSLFAALSGGNLRHLAVSLLPVAAIVGLSRARALFVPYFLMMVFYAVESLRRKPEIKWGRIFLLAVPLAVAMLMGVLAMSGDEFGVYPIWRDFCLQDGYFCFERHEELYTGGTNLRFLLTTWIPGIDKSKFVDICRLVPDLKFAWKFEPTLHVTHYAWFFTDIGGCGWLAGMLLGLFLAFFDRLRVDWAPDCLSSVLLPFELMVIPVLVRGSVCYAITNVMYQLMLFTTLSFGFRFRQNAFRQQERRLPL